MWLYFWNFFWILVMLGLVTAFVVVAMREKKAKDKALKELAPQPLDEAELEGTGEDMMSDGFGEPEGEPAELDENALN